MTLDTNLIIGLIVGAILMWILDWWLYGGNGRGTGSSNHELEELKSELAIYKKARTTAEAHLQTAEAEIVELKNRLSAAESSSGAATDCQEKLTAAHARIAELETEVEELSTAVAREKAEDAAVAPMTLSAMKADKPDDLKVVEGIGPKIEGILHEAGIKTFAQLASTSVAALEKIVREDAGIKVAFPDTWPQQAGLAAAGKWEELERLQDQLKGGRQA